MMLSNHRPVRRRWGTGILEMSSMVWPRIPGSRCRIPPLISLAAALLLRVRCRPVVPLQDVRRGVALELRVRRRGPLPFPRLPMYQFLGLGLNDLEGCGDVTITPDKTV